MATRTSTRGRKPTAKKAAATTSPQPEAAALNEARVQADSIVAEAEKRASATIARATEEAEHTVQSLLDEAQQKADALRADAKQTVEQMKNSAEQAAKQLLDQAKTDSDTLLANASNAVEETRATAKTEAADRITQATTDADRIRHEANTQAQELLARAHADADILLAKARAEAERLRTEAERTLALGREDAERIRTDAETEANRLRSAGAADRDRAQREAERLRQHAQETADALRAKAEETSQRIRATALAEAEQIRTDVHDELSLAKDAQNKELQRQRNQAIDAVGAAEELAKHKVDQAEDERRRILTDAKNEANGMRARAAAELRTAEETRTEAEEFRKGAARLQAEAAEELGRAVSKTVQRLEKRKLKSEAAEERRTAKRNAKEAARAGRPTWAEQIRKALQTIAVRFLTIVPILAPMGVAWTGQSGFAIKVLGWSFIASLVYAAAYELATAFCAWLYDQARQDGDKGWGYRIATWLFGAGAAIQQWWHYSTDWTATPRAVTFSVMSMVGVILWEMLASLRHRRKLRESRNLPPALPSLGLARWLRYPGRSWTARSLMIDNPDRWADATTAWTAAGRILADRKARRDGIPYADRYVVSVHRTGPDTGPAAIPVVGFLERVSPPAPASETQAIETETRPALPAGETKGPDGSHPASETGLAGSRETGETGETESHSRPDAETETTETRKTESRETATTRSPRSRETTHDGSRETAPPRSRPQETNRSTTVSPLPDKATETQKLLDLMWERGGAATVQLGSKTLTGEAETVTGRPRSTAAKRLAEARALFEAGHRTYRETETGATGTDG
ncbi:hypothetical protein [Streptomyces filamentosus]|uniref:hypothetical protein n=1 Tax=Streptomyces filamentosus TaxID=67294 RepID=UPI0033F99B2E